MERKEEIEAYLARIRKTIAESNALLEQADLRLQETDRFLASQGLTREQVLGFQVTSEQEDAVNAELKRCGLPPLEPLDDELVVESARVDLRGPGGVGADPPDDGDLESRKRKFGSMMQQFRL